MAPVLSARVTPAAPLRLAPRRARGRASASRNSSQLAMSAVGNGARPLGASLALARHTVTGGSRCGHPAASAATVPAAESVSRLVRSRCAAPPGNKDAAWDEMSATAKLNQAELLRRKAAEAIAAQAALMEARRCGAP